MLVIEPRIEDLAVDGRNILRGTANEAVAERAYAQTRELLTVGPTLSFIESAAS